MDSAMRIEIDQQNDVSVIRFQGRFVTGADLDLLRAKTDQIRQLSRGKVLADFREVPFIGSTGIGFIVGVYISVTNNGGRFVLAGLQPRVRELFDLTRLSTIIPLTKDLDSGLAALREQAHSAQRA